MQKVQKITKETCLALRKEMNELLKKYGATINLDIDVGNMRFSAGEVDIKIKGKVIGATTMSDQSLEIQMTLNNLQKVNAAGDELIGFERRRWKRPFSYIKKSDGKNYICDVNYAKMLFGKK